MEKIYYSTLQRQHRRDAVRQIANALGRICEAEYDYADSLMAGNPDSCDYMDAKYSADTVLDVISLLCGAYD